ncbi:MAG: Stp1/IreP family PP2C-type Ser/Thr phosphatase [Oscillospiraceae bacterium]|jgi:protein phosphatase|nr:Stp1/IreP family PP2C-type Ser/Thr phosphatase [Oscillospiraceae bacterium]
MKISAKTHTGQVRHVNEDYCAVHELGEHATLVVVCDGMGGAAGGDVASKSAADFVVETVQNAYRPQSDSRFIKHMLVAALSNANNLVFGLSQQDDGLFGMGTTMVAALLTAQTVHIAHVGDSRAYLYQQGMLRQLTRDHSVVQALVDSGQITEVEARIHPRRNLITRVLGVEEQVDIDYCEHPLQEGDIVLVCTDGLTNTVNLARALPLLLEQSLFDELAEDLVALANRNGGGDNITVAAVRI